MGELPPNAARGFEHLKRTLLLEVVKPCFIFNFFIFFGMV
jgi:hypothetical protein